MQINWVNAKEEIIKLSKELLNNKLIDEGQCASLHFIAEKLQRHGCIIADEVGTGKTRIATTLARAIKQIGGRVAIVIPPGLGGQWKDEFQKIEISVPNVIKNVSDWYTWISPKGSDAPEKNINDENILMISHGFFRSYQARSFNLHELFPLFYARLQQDNGRAPNGYIENDYVEELHNIYDYYKAKWPIKPLFKEYESDEKFENVRMIPKKIYETLYDTELYKSGKALRPYLNKIIGIGFGKFDFLIIDEAHKSRSDDSMLQNVLDVLSLKKNDQSRTVALTATPIELDVKQWDVPLQRINVDKDTIAQISKYSIEFKNSTQQLQCYWNKDEDTYQKYLQQYKESARNYYSLLREYITRRRKIDEDDYKHYLSNNPNQDYRNYKDEVKIRLRDIPHQWQEFLIALEGLSFASNKESDIKSKRHRLIPSLSTASLLSEVQRNPAKDAGNDEEQLEYEASYSKSKKQKTVKEETVREKYWISKINNVFKDKNASLFNYPEIVKAALYIHKLIIDSYESKTQEKVLVFGRFTRPMKALMTLINALHIKYCLKPENKMYWPYKSLGYYNNESTENELSLEKALMSDLFNELHTRDNRYSSETNIHEINRMLEEQFNNREQDLDSLRSGIVSKVRDALQSESDDTYRVFTKLLKDENLTMDHFTKFLMLSTSAYIKQLDESEYIDQAKDYFVNLIQGFSDTTREKTYANNNDTDEEMLDNIEILEKLKDMINEELDENSSMKTGSFARLMYGNTKTTQRKNLQVRFNKSGVWPMVLICQSVVGREGLNLQEACRHVVLFHAEWNPAITEQQIGRVDRKQSLWSKLIHDDITSNEQIYIHPVIFSDTYDQKNWEVLTARMKLLRAQLNGEIVPQSDIDEIEDENERIRLQKRYDEIKECSPNFSPLKSD